MKKIFALFAALMLSIASASAISYDYAARQAYYLTDKMAYELNLTDAQYDEVYRINLDYFLKCEAEADITGYLWEYRNACLARVLYTAQWRLFNTFDYFFRPLRWVNHRWHFPVYERYGRTHFYRPAPPPSYRGPRPGDMRPGGPGPGDMRPGSPGPKDNHNGYRGGGRRGDNHPAGQPNVGGNRGGDDRPAGQPNVGGNRGGNDRPAGQPNVGSSRPSGSVSRPSATRTGVSSVSRTESRPAMTSRPSSSSLGSSPSVGSRSVGSSRPSVSSGSRASSPAGGGSRGGSRAGRR